MQYYTCNYGGIWISQCVCVFIKEGRLGLEDEQGGILIISFIPIQISMRSYCAQIINGAENSKITHLAWQLEYTENVMK